MMNDDISLRPAQPDDADRAAVLLYSAYIHRQVSYPFHEEGENRFIERLRHYFREVRNRFSYQSIQVAEPRCEVVGLVLSFGGREEERLNAALGWHLEREAEEDEWYVDAPVSYLFYHGMSEKDGLVSMFVSLLTWERRKS
jgi:hypothetical protein